jgi:hypothetical protein
MAFTTRYPLNSIDTLSIRQVPSSSTTGLRARSNLIPFCLRYASVYPFPALNLLQPSTAKVVPQAIDIERINDKVTE